MNVAVPKQIASGGLTVSAGTYHTCGTFADGSAVCWGSNSYQQLAELPMGRAVAAGAYHTCAVASDGTLWYAGDGIALEQIGTATTWSTVGAGGHHSCAIQADGSLWCWGLNDYGQLGDGEAWKATPFESLP